MRVFSNLLIITIFSTYISYITSTYRFVFKAISDGARSPSSSLDANNKDMFEEEWLATGILTSVGIRQLYLLGTKDRETYKSFLNQTYKSNELYVRASASNNTLMSANAYLQGLYPPGTGPNLYPDQRTEAFPPVIREFGSFNLLNFGSQALPFNTQVFPVKTFDQLDRKYFFFNFNNCGSLQKKIDKNQKLDKVVNWLEQFRLEYGEKLQKVLFTNTIDEFLDYDYVSNILNTFVADYTDGKILKKFTDQGIDLKNFNVTAYEFLNMDIYDVKNGYETDAFLPNATMSGFKDELKMWFERAQDKNNTYSTYLSYARPKMVLFSVPRHVIGALLAYLGRDKGIELLPVTFASSISFELSESTDSSFNIDIVYDGKKLKTLKYDEFISLLDSAPDEMVIRKQCSNHLIDRYGWKNACIAMAAITGVLLILFIVLLVCCCKNQNKEGHKQEGFKDIKNSDGNEHSEFKKEEKNIRYQQNMVQEEVKKENDNIEVKENVNEQVNNQVENIDNKEKLEE
jgi:hypothetical protein